MLEFDTTEVRSTCDKNCKYHITFYSKERVFLHSNNCNRRWTNEGRKGKYGLTESVSRGSNTKRGRSTQPSGFVTLDKFSMICKHCKDVITVAGYTYCWECESWLRPQ